MSLIKLIIISGILAFFSCNSKNQNQGIHNAEPDVVSEIKTDTIDYLKIAAKFAQNFNPISSRKRVVQILDKVPDRIANAFKHLRKSSNQANEYLTLIFLKLYRSHFECCHQSYELRTKIPKEENIDSIADPLLYEFNIMTNYLDNTKRIEFISSAIAYDWVEKNEHYIENNLIKKECNRIEKVYKNIQEGVYWK